MRYIIAAVAVIGILLLSIHKSNAGQVNPTSNVMGDTAGTANTLVYRDSNGQFDGAQLKAASVDTTKLGVNAVDTGKLNILPASVDSGKIVCIVGGNQSKFGTCTANSVGISVCNCQ